MAPVSDAGEEAVALTAAERAWLEDHATIRLTPDPLFPPYEYFDEDNEFRGIGAEFVALLETKLGIRFDVVRVDDWQQSVARTKARENDVWSVVAETPERAEYMLFTEPYIESPAVIVVRSDVERHLAVKDLKGLKVAISDGYAVHETLKRRHPEMKFDAVPDPLTGLNKVSFGSADAMVINVALASHLMEKAGISNLRMAGTVDYVYRWGFASRKDWPVLHGILVKGLAAISAAERQAIIRTWVALRKPAWKPTTRQITFAVLILFVLVIIAALAWTRSLRLQIAHRTRELAGELEERSRIEEALRTSEARFRDFADASADWFWEMGPDLRFSYVSERIEEVTGVPAAYHIGKSREEIAGESAQDEKWREHLRQLKLYQPFSDFRFLRRGHDDRLQYMSTSGKPIYDDQGQFSGYRGTGVDITERVLALDALSSAEERNRLILNSVADGIYGVDREGTATFVNPAALKSFGYAAEDLVGHHIHDLIHHTRADGSKFPVEECPMYWSIVDGEARHVVDEVFWRKDGTSFPVEYTATPIRKEDKVVGAVVAFSDVTQRREVERLKNEFISTVSHELRTPLTSIKGALGLIKGQVVGDLPGKLEAMLEIAHKNSDRLVRLINDILDIEKIEAGKMDLQKQRIDVRAVVEDAISEILGFAVEREISLVIGATYDDARVDADADRLMQVLTNLMSNAVKFSPPGGKVEIEVARENGMVRISVVDHGPGIATDYQARIFEKFSQVDASDSRERGGTGLGLSISKSIVEMHGGEIDLRSELGDGATFFFTLPEVTSGGDGAVRQQAARGLDIVR